MKTTSNHLFNVLSRYVDLPPSCVEIRLSLYHDKNATVEVDYYERDSDGNLVIDHSRGVVNKKTTRTEIERLLI